MFGANKFKHGSVWSGYNDPATILFTASTLYGINEQKKAGEAQAQSQQAQKRMSEIDAQKQRIAQVREARIRRAQILASKGGTGPGTSAIVGGMSAITSQERSNIGTINQTQDLASQASAYNQQAADAASRAGVAGAVANVTNTLFPIKESFAKAMGGYTLPSAGTTNNPATPATIFNSTDTETWFRKTR